MTVTDDGHALLEQRARDLARPAGTDGDVATAEVLVVTAGSGARYGFETRQVRAVLRAGGLRRLPAGAGALGAVVPARGEVVPVADLAAVLGLASSGPGAAFVVVLDGPPALGLLVGDASDVLQVPVDRLGGIGQRRADRLELGVAEDGTVVLDAGALVNRPDLTVAGRSPAARTHDPRQETDA